METERILDPCCGSRMFWFDRKNTDVIYGDNRTEEHVLCDGRTLRIEPDVKLDFTELPFENGRFNLVVFDPPHLHTAGSKSWMAAKYGKLSSSWQVDLRNGFSECFRVLANDGVLVFKWNETQVKIREVLALTSIQPLFGHPTGRKGLTHWMVFMKPKERF
jgi:SAM-dependent methyltransferase